jgi:putative DNA methylase
LGLYYGRPGAAILYAVSCNLSDRDLVARHAILEQTGSTLKLLPWTARKSAGYDPVLDTVPHPSPLPAFAERTTGEGANPPSPSGRGDGGEGEVREMPLIDQAHRLMHVWKAGDVTKVDAYLDARGLRRSALFHQLLQALIELAPAGGEERALLESISNHLGGRRARAGEQIGLTGGAA